MQYVDATFSLCGSDSQWNLQLSVCPCSAPTVRANGNEDLSTAESACAREMDAKPLIGRA